MIILRNTYRFEPDQFFDEAYFVNKHFQLAREILAPHFTASRVLRAMAPDDETPAERLIVEFEFPSEAVMKQALASPRMADLAADNVNYTDKRGEISFLSDHKS